MASKKRIAKASAIKPGHGARVIKGWIEVTAKDALANEACRMAAAGKLKRAR